MLYLWLGLFAVMIVGLDQLVKYLTITYIPLGEAVSAIDGLFHLTYVRNTGASFSMLEGNGWLFVAILVVFTVVLAIMLWKKVITKKFELWCLAAIWAGGVANAIDRVIYGYVVDMFEVEFMHFAVFNVADIFITCGCIALCIYVLLFDHSPKKPKEGDAA